METTEHDMEDPSGLIAKLRAALRRNGNGHRTGYRQRVFGSNTFWWLWLAQVISSIGDWLGFLAVLALASRIGTEAGTAGTSIGLVMAARIAPGLFFSAAAGVLVDRMDRKQVMVVTTLMRAAVVAALPWVDSVLGLVFASLVLELATMLFSPAKEATVPNLVPADKLPSANSLGLAAAYGTFPLGAILFAILSRVAEWLGQIDALDFLRTTQEAVAFYVAGGCYVLSAVMVSRLAIPKHHVRLHEDEEVDLGQAFRELKEGWHYAFINPVVRAVNLGLATGLIGGGMLVPLAQVFSIKVLSAGSGGFGLFVAALGLGVGAGVIVVSVRQETIRKDRAFVRAVFGAGFTLVIGASMSALWAALIAVFVMGIFAGRAYVLGFTLLHENVDDELRGRVFAGLYILVRVCVLLSMAVSPVIADLLDGISEGLVDGEIGVGAVEIAMPGVRLTLWISGAIMLLAAVLARRSMRAAYTAESGQSAEPEPSEGPEPSAEPKASDEPASAPLSESERPAAPEPSPTSPAESSG